ncbi:hypothetical protein Tco_0320220 [Tanacetum coccineum]
MKGKSVDTNFEKQSILGKPPLQPIKNQPVIRQPTAYKSEQSQVAKHRSASQVDVSNNLTKPVTAHYLPKERESAFAKSHHVIVSSESRNSLKNMPRFSSNEMVHNHYLEEAKKKTQERVIMEALDEFKNASGLTLSLPKSTAYFCTVLNHVKLSILQILPFEEGRLLVKYLGVTLVSSRLIYKDCKEPIEKVQNRVNDWKNKSLSVAGRLKLVQSVIGSLNVFWASVFVLPNRILLDIEQIMRGFLWCQGSMRHGKAKVAWDVVCLPKDEGGLGHSIDDILDDIILFAKIKTLKSIIAKLVVAATVYFIWQEQNSRLFKNVRRTVTQVIDCIMNLVRLKLLSCRLKKTKGALELIRVWNCPMLYLQFNIGSCF